MRILEKVNGRKRVISGIDFMPITTKEELMGVVFDLLTQLNFKPVEGRLSFTDGREDKSLSFNYELTVNMGKDSGGYSVIESFDLAMFLHCLTTKDYHKYFLTLSAKEESNWNFKLRDFCVQIVTETRGAYQRLGFI